MNHELYGNPLVVASMRALYEQRENKRRSVAVTSFPDLLGIDENVWLGTSSWSLVTSRLRLVLNDAQITAYGMKPHTAPEVVRDYLDVKHPKKLRARSEQVDWFKVPRSFPYLAVCGEYHDMAYVDLVGAYWTIVQVLGWDVEYLPGGFLGKRSDMLDFPYPHIKSVRNMLVSAGMIDTVNMWQPQRIVPVNIGNKHKNMGLYTVTQDVLHACAKLAENLGAVYVHTDGYIVPMANVPALVTRLAEWGLPARVKHEGNAVVKGVGMYRVGGYKTATYADGWGGDMSHIEPVYPEWLMKRFSRFAEHTPLFYGRGSEHNTGESVWTAGLK